MLVVQEEEKAARIKTKVKAREALQVILRIVSALTGEGRIVRAIEQLTIRE